MEDLEDSALDTKAFQKKWELESKVSVDLHGQISKLQEQLQHMSTTTTNPQGHPLAGGVVGTVSPSVAAVFSAAMFTGDVMKPVPVVSSAAASDVDDEMAEIQRQMGEKASGLKNLMEAGAGPPPHGLSSNTMALITTDCNSMRYLRTKWP